MTIIDIHPHVISDDAERFPPAPLAGKQSKWSRDKSMPHNQMIAAMDSAGVSKATLVQAATCYGYDNSYVADAMAAHPDRLGGICTIDALAPDAAKVLEDHARRGFDGARLFVSGTSIETNATWFAEPQTDPFWAAAAALKMPVCLQIAWETVPLVPDLMVRHPGVKVVLDHMGRPPFSTAPPHRDAQPFFALADTPDLYLKITPVNSKSLTATLDEPAAFLPELVARFGANRIAWGSNFPSTTDTLTEALSLVQDLATELQGDDRAALFGGTALSLYPSLAAR